MAATTSQVTKSLGTTLVVGGSGFLGGKIALLLKERGACTSLHSVDLRPPQVPIEKIEYHSGDITDYAAMTRIFQKVKPSVVIHTASPHHTIADRGLMYKVNVDGTKNLLKVSQEQGVKAFVFTSSASVISDSVSDLVNANEEYPLCMGDEQPEYYTSTKAMAEVAVLKANRPASHPRFLTAAIRPSGIFGVGDVQLLPPGLSAYFKGQTRFQIGDNNNLFDFTEVTNVAHAHHLAAAALLATADRDAQGQVAPLEHEKVDGEVFLITNDQPVYFFDFARMVWSAAGDETRPDQIWVLGKEFGLFVSSMLEWIFWLFRLGKPNLTRQQVKFTCMTRYYDISKAKSRLGYKPVVPLDEGVKRGVADVLRRGAVPNMPEALKGKVPPKLQRELDRLDKKA